MEPLTQTVVFNGLNSTQQAAHRIKQGYFLIEENKFKIPLIYAFDMRDSNGIEMLIGANFLRSMKGGIRIKGDEITIYKKVTKIKTSNQTEIIEIAELEVSEEEFLEINKSIYFNQEVSRAFQEQFKPVIDRLKQQGYIGEEPLKHWIKNAMEDLYRKHVDSLLKIGAIRPSKSRHRTMAMIVNSGTTIDLVTRREVKGKERMTAFLVPGGLYEWMVMPFGLKNAPAVFQRKMDKCFKGTESFIAVYINDILVFSKNEKDHAKHLERMLKMFEDNGLVLSPTKMKITVSTVDFLGAVIGEGTIKLQPHIIKKIVNFNEEELKIKKGLRSFLGILNYARNHIPKLGILLRPLYEKTNAHGDKRLKPSDYEFFADAVTGTGVKINIEHIEGKHNTLAGSLSRLVNLCFAECTGEMKELAAAALYSVEEVLYSPNAFQKNMKTTCEEVMKISNHFLKSSQKLSSHLKNQEHYTNVTSSRPIKPQSEWINLMHGDQSPKTLNFQQQKKQLKPCETYKQSYNAKPKYALDNQPKTTTGQTKEKMFEFKTKKPKESSSNWKPWHKDWDAITSNHPEDDAIKDGGKYRYNRKGFLEDDESSDDSILIVDPGWDDYCLQQLKLNRPVPLCPETRRARM
ncbi:Orf y [Tanacetum coccineum]